MDNNKEIKIKLRREIKERIFGLTDEYLYDSGKKISSAVIESAFFKNAESVFLYISMKNEPDAKAILDAALNNGKRVYVPKCYPNHIMKAVRITDTDDLIPGYLDIPEPRNIAETTDAKELDLIIVPCVSASLDGKRLGHGAGYYDRFLDSSDTLKVCLCFEKLLSDDIPMSVFDTYMDYVVTENGIYKTK